MYNILVRYLLILNFLALVLNLLDKYLLKKKLSDLFILVISSLGGVFGTYIVFHFFKHKTEEKSLRKIFYPIFIIWLIVIIIVIMKKGDL